MKRTQVDLNACTIRLEPGCTKNEDGRLVYLTPELLELLQAQEERGQLLEMEMAKPVPWLFPPSLRAPAQGTTDPRFPETVAERLPGSDP